MRLPGFFSLAARRAASVPGPGRGSAAFGVAVVAFTAKGHTVSHVTHGEHTTWTQTITGFVVLAIVITVSVLFKRWLRAGERKP
jgi:uncharacterized membrane protein YidH (DUF202 family)